jgi:hypothetical protein
MSAIFNFARTGWDIATGKGRTVNLPGDSVGRAASSPIHYSFNEDLADLEWTTERLEDCMIGTRHGAVGKGGSIDAASRVASGSIGYIGGGPITNIVGEAKGGSIDAASPVALGRLLYSEEDALDALVAYSQGENIVRELLDGEGIVAGREPFSEMYWRSRAIPFDSLRLETTMLERLRPHRKIISLYANLFRVGMPTAMLTLTSGFVFGPIGAWVGASVGILLGLFLNWSIPQNSRFR